MIKDNLCEAGHKEHKLIKVSTIQGDMFVYDDERYQGFKGYCTGQDDVSRTIARIGSWELTETRLIKKLLENGDRKRTVIDFGAHVGWFTILAAKLGYDVVAFEGEPENARTLYKNVELHEVGTVVGIHQQWIDESSSRYETSREIELFKADIEGNEQHAVGMFKDLFIERRICNAVLEISPTFNDSYPSLVEFIQDRGYRVYDLAKPDVPFNGVYDFPQTNFLFVRDDNEADS